MNFNLLLKQIIVTVVEYFTGLVTKILTGFFSGLTGKEPEKE